MSDRFIVMNNSSFCDGFLIAFQRQQRQTVVWIDCLFVGQKPDDLKSALHGVLSWLCVLERVIVPVLSVPFFTSCISVFHQAAITGYSYTGQALFSQHRLVVSENVQQIRAIYRHVKHLGVVMQTYVRCRPIWTWSGKKRQIPCKCGPVLLRHEQILVGLHANVCVRLSCWVVWSP